MTTMQLPTFIPRPALLTRLRLLIALGVIGTLVGLIAAPKLTLGGLLLGACYSLGMGLGAMVIISLSYITKAGWSTALRRIPESMAATLPLTCLILLIILAAGFYQLYPWFNSHEHGHADASLTLWRKPAFFLARAAGCMIIWLIFSFAILRNSRKQDLSGDLRLTHRNVGLSAVFLFALAITLSLATFDWFMSLQPHWISTMLGVYHFSGLFQSAIAAMIVITILLQRAGLLQQIVKPAHLHDLGKYLFCFTTFWGYIWFCQYMLIWYSNIPEETSYFILRHNGPWLAVAYVTVAMNWAIPFFGLLSATTKRNDRLLFKLAVIVLIGHWIDLYGIIVPSLAGDATMIDFWSVLPSLILLPIFVLGMMRALRASPLMPARDPMLVESLHHH
ncbi:MAG: hypothetical protein IT447_02350 [Phycisphaerales bacterium]|jgi:hypothetical protein|nr:hypothetical protein [Phycisphaerales bacterium]